MSDQDRKATDILLSIEEKITSLIQVIAVYDMNTKLILDKVNKLSKMIEGQAAPSPAIKSETTFLSLFISASFIALSVVAELNCFVSS